MVGGSFSVFRTAAFTCCINTFVERISPVPSGVEIISPTKGSFLFSSSYTSSSYFQAAHESAADTADLGRVQCQILVFCHFDRHRLEIPQECCAAQSSAANADAAEHFRFITDTDLPQFDTHTEHCRQLFYQFTEVYTTVRGKVKDQFILIECHFHIHQFHVQFQTGNLL